MPARTPSSNALLCAVLLVATGAVRADEVDDVARQFRAGQTGEALAHADRYLAGKPGDAAMRFQKGVMLSELGRGDEAIDVFTRLTQEFPGLAEPYNNLGVLLSSRGEYDQALVALETAIRNNPSYAIAHENLGDIHAALAGRAYARAIALDPGNATAPPKLKLIRELLARTTRGAAQAPALRAAPAS